MVSVTGAATGTFTVVSVTSTVLTLSALGGSLPSASGLITVQTLSAFTITRTDALSFAPTN